MEFQTIRGISADGVVGPVTFYTIGLNNSVTAPTPLGIAWPPSVPPAHFPCCIVLFPTNAILPIEPFLRGASLNYAGTRPPLLRAGVWGVVATFLPDPATFGNFDRYEAVLYHRPTGLASEMDLTETPDGAWAGELTNVIGGTELSTDWRVLVRVIGPAGTGPNVLTGRLADCNL